MRRIEETEIISIRLTIGIIKEIDGRIIEVNKLQERKTDRSKFIRKAIKKELEE